MEEVSANVDCIPREVAREGQGLVRGCWVGEGFGEVFMKGGRRDGRLEFIS
jgi:hypothetical protein